MAKKKVSRSRIADFRALKWVLNNLEEKELDAADAMDFDVIRFAEWLEILVEKEGFDFKFGWDVFAGCFQMTLIGAWTGFVNTGYAVSARSDAGFEDCARLLVFKVETIALRDLSSVYSEQPRRPKRG